MNALNKKILLELTKNSRIPLTLLSKKVRASREVVNYRVSSMIKEKIIGGFTTEVNTQRLGFVSAALFINIKSKREKEFIEFIKNSGFASWGSEFSGVWRFGVDIYGKNNEELHERIKKIYGLFKDDIIEQRATIYKNKLFFYEKYFEGNKDKIIIRDKNYKIDKKDKLILNELSNNSRIDSVELSKKIDLTAPAISNRVKNLFSSGFIKNYSIFLDISKLNLFQYSLFIENKDINQREKLLNFLSAHKNVSFIAEYIGDPFLEFGIFVNDPYELRTILQDIEESFPDNRIKDLFLIQKEFVSVGPPRCVFE
jgi:Lrp/AsnC family leucine-responsive transcriptional regulator